MTRNPLTDIHCHILPGLDDGADTQVETLKMARLAVSGGSGAVICTPHANLPGLYENHASPLFFRILAAVQALLKRNRIPLTLYPGQEICLSGRFLPLLREGKLIPLAASRYLLCEFLPDESLPTALDKLGMLLAEGYIPIVAHPERCPFASEFPDAPRRMRQLGCLLQINKGSLKGAFGPDAAMLAHRLLESRTADFIASDGHSPWARTPYLSDIHESVAEHFSYDYADFLLRDNPMRVIANRKIERY